MERFIDARKRLVDSDLFSLSLLLLAMPTLGLMIQCVLFLFGKTCSPFPMWTSFLVFSLLALLNHWKSLLKFWGLVLLALFFTAYTFSYMQKDSECYHIPMQILLKEGWNPVFDSSIEKFKGIVNVSTLWETHTLFLPKTVALCGALVAQATGLWIADSFLGYILIFVLFRISYVFAQEIWKCKWTSCFLFASTIILNSKFTTLLEGRNDYYIYSSLMIALLSLFLYAYRHQLHDYLLAILATAICSTSKSTGLVNCIFLWGVFWICCLWKCKIKEAWLGSLTVIFLIVLIGVSPLVTSWIQYGSPLYPSMTFDPKISPIDITSDFIGNADGERMGHLARFVYAWISPALAKKACAIYYHKADFDPVFMVTGGVGGFMALNLFLCGSVVLLVLAKKNLISLACLFLLITLSLCPTKYIGFGRYFPQAWAVIPLGFFQFVFSPPAWIERRKLLKCLSQYCLLGILCLLCVLSAMNILSFQIQCIIVEDCRQDMLASFRDNDVVFLLPQESNRAFTLSKRLVCADVDYKFSQKTADYDHLDDDVYFLQFKEYYIKSWRLMDRYPAVNTPSALLRFRWQDVFTSFPHPLFYHRSKTPDNPTLTKDTPHDNTDTNKPEE